MKKCILCDAEFETKKYGEARKFCFECSPPGGRAAAVTAIRRRSKIVGVQKLGGKCRKCGTDKVYLLDFHHRDPVEKEEALATLSKNYDFDKYFEELKKCDLLCANCHREFHYLNAHDGITYDEYLRDAV